MMTTSTSKKKTVLNIFIFVLLYFVLGIISAFPFLILSEMGLMSTNNALIISTIISNLLSYFLLYRIFSIERPKFKEEFKRLNIKDISHIFVLVIALFAITASVSSILSLMFKPVDQEVKSIILGNPVFGLLLGIVVAPVFEEILYRDILRKIFNNDKIFMFVSPILFGLIHIQGFENGIYNAIYPVIGTSVAGLFFAIIYIKRNNIVFNMLLHSIYNSIVLLLTYIVTTAK